MTTGALLKALGRRGVRLEARGSHLVVDGPADALPDDLIERLRALKTELLVLLAANPPGALWDARDWQVYFEERAGIREFDGGLPRTEAEPLALEDAVTHWLCLHPAPASDPRHGCVHCDSGDGAGDTLLPVLAPGGHVWVHDRCWGPWQRARRHEAQEALRRFGLSLPMVQLSCELPARGCRAS